MNTLPSRSRICASITILHSGQMLRVSSQKIAGRSTFAGWGTVIKWPLAVNYRFHAVGVWSRLPPPKISSFRRDRATKSPGRGGNERLPEGLQPSKPPTKEDEVPCCRRQKSEPGGLA